MNVNRKSFTTNPTNLNIPRSRFKRTHNSKLTFDGGQLIPIYMSEILPGDTVDMKMSEVTRMQTPLFPVMDNAFIDTYFFFVPNRLLWEHWEEFMGENKTGIWEQTTEYEIPTIKFNTDDTVKTTGAPDWIKGDKWYDTAVQTGSLADYLGIPVVDPNSDNPRWRGEFEVNALPFRAYYQIYNDWFRDENLMYPIEFDKGDATVVAQMGGDPEETLPLIPPKYVAKFHDFFTSALPQPQKSDDILLPLGNMAPVVGNGLALGITDGNNKFGAIAHSDNAGIFAQTPAGETLPKNGDGSGPGFDNSAFLGVTTDAEKSGLIADLSLATGATINALRQAFAVQKFFEQSARGGSRYTEIVRSMFGVTSDDARLQRAEFLGGNRRAINIDQVLQTSGTNNGGTMTQRVSGKNDATVYDIEYDSTPQGNVSAYSLTTMKDSIFTKSFTEHGILMGVQCVRHERTYQDGLNKFWNKRNKFDFYFPVFAHIGEQPIYNKEIYLTGNQTGTKDDEAFGYQEAWAEYRYQPNEVHGEFRSDFHQSLDSWHWADNYFGLPSLSYGWIEDDSWKQFNRTCAVSEKLAHQFMSDIWFDATFTRPMPVYSIPGLIDHM